MEHIVFELDLLEEARDFLKSLTKEVRGKIGLIYGAFRKESVTMNFSRNLMVQRYGSFALSIIRHTIDYLPFGIRKSTPWSLPLTALSRRHKRHHKMKLPRQRVLENSIS